MSLTEIELDHLAELARQRMDDGVGHHGEQWRLGGRTAINFMIDKLRRLATPQPPKPAGAVPLPEPPKPTYVHPALGEMWDRLDLQRHAIAYGDAREAAARSIAPLILDEDHGKVLGEMMARTFGPSSKPLTEQESAEIKALHAGQIALSQMSRATNGEAACGGVPVGWLYEFADPDPQFDFEKGAQCPDGWVGKARPLFGGRLPLHVNSVEAIIAGQRAALNLGWDISEHVAEAMFHSMIVAAPIPQQPAAGSRGRADPDLLWCPRCHVQHVDAPDDRTAGWENPPHRSHLCHACGCIWRPADVPTVGVAAIETRGKADTFDAAEGAGRGAVDNIRAAINECERRVISSRHQLDRDHGEAELISDAFLRLREAFVKMQTGTANPSPVADAEDTERLDWLVGMAVEVRDPLRYGSRLLFHAQQVSDDGEAHQTDLRARIDAARKATGADHA